MVRAMKVMTAGLPGGVSFMEDYTYHLDDDGDLSPRARTCSRSASRSPARGHDSRSTRCRSAARPTRSGSSSTPIRARPSSPRSPTWASGSGWSRRSSTSSPRSGRCPSCRSPGPCGGRAPTSRPTPPPGSMPAARITRASGFAVTPEHLADFAAMSGVEFLLIDEHDRARSIPRPAPLERPLLPPRARPLSVDRSVFSTRAGPGSPPTVRPAIIPASSPPIRAIVDEAAGDAGPERIGGERP